MKDKKILYDFALAGDFSDDAIGKFSSDNGVSKKEMVKGLFFYLNFNIKDEVPTIKEINTLNNVISLLTVLCNKLDFTKDEVDFYKKKIKFGRDVLLSVSKHYNNMDLLNAANRLDELVIDKNIDSKDLVVVIKKLIDRRESCNIIKKLVAVNKNVIFENKNELFDYTFNKAMDVIKGDSSAIFYYITLLKIVYNSKIDRKKYIKLLNTKSTLNNKYANEIYNIIHGIKRPLSPNEILDKYYIEKNLECANIIIPAKEECDDIVITIDNDSTRLRDDGISIRQDGDKYIVGIHIADVPSNIDFNSNVERQARANYKAVFLPDYRTRVYNRNIEDRLTMDQGKCRKVLSLNIVLNSNGELVDRYLSTQVVKIHKNFTYSNADNIIKGKQNSDYKGMLQKLYAFADAYESTNPNKIVYWDSKTGHDDGDKQSDVIIRESMVLYNSLISQIAYNDKIPFVYKIQDAEYISSLITGLGIRVSSSAMETISKIYMVSKFSDVPGRHTGLGSDSYSQVSSPLRRYTDTYNQYLLHNFIFKDKMMDFDYDQYLNMIAYFNQRNEELSLMKAEYTREIKLLRKDNRRKERR